MRWKFLLYLLPVIYSTYAAAERLPRHIVQRKPSFSNSLQEPQYPLCEVGGVIAACLPPSECHGQRGRFMGQCQEAGLQCCFVEKTCNSETSSHAVTFRNPSYPKPDNGSGLCSLVVNLGRGICGARVDLDVFELAKYEDSVCIRDTLTILGSKEIATPVCGNMTGFSTSFVVKEFGKVTLVLVSQSEHRFSITVSQLDCQNISPFVSPTYAGIRNVDAVKYEPPSTPKPTKNESPIIVIRDSGNSSAEVTTVTPKEDDDDEEDDDKDEEKEESVTTANPNTSAEKSKPARDNDGDTRTTLKRGVYPSKKTPATPAPEVITKKKADPYEDIFEEAIDVTPTISDYKKIFELKVQDKCWLYEEDDPFESPSFRIIGGFDANINEYPWQAALVFRSSKTGKYKFFCGASLISDRHVLTAGHCLFGSFSKGIYNLTVSLGDHDLTTKNDTENVKRKIKRVFWHLNYSPKSNINDIAILELDSPVDFSYSISAVNLPLDSDDKFIKVNATVTGWGRYEAKSRKKTSPTLKKFTGPLYNSTKCAEKWKKFPTVEAYADRHLCLNVTYGTPCHGDSGGPLVVCSGPQCTQVGVVSFGFPLCTNVGLPAVFTRVTYYRPWLNVNLAPLYSKPVQGALDGLVL